MKLYSRKHFLLGMVCILPVIYEFKHYTGGESVIWIGFFLYLMVRCIMTAFSAERLEQDEANAQRDRKIRKMLLGPIWWIPPVLLMLAPMLAGAVIFALWPSELSGVVIFIGIVAAVAFTLWYNVRYRELIQKESDHDEEQKS